MKRPVAWIAGTGRSVPAHVMTNHDFAAIGIETSHEWIVERSGIHQRHIQQGQVTCPTHFAEIFFNKIINGNGIPVA